MIANSDTRKEFLLYGLSAATFIIFFQIYMVAPIIPSLSVFFRISEQAVSDIVPAFLIPYGVFSLFYGVFADQIGTKKVILTSSLVFIILTVGTTFSQNITQMLIWRTLAGVGAGGVIPISLAWIGKTYAYEKRGQPIGYIFGAVAGEGAFGAFAGALLESYVGWKILFLIVAGLALLIWGVIFRAYRVMELKPTRSHLSLPVVFKSYKELLLTKRGGTAYLYVMLNGIFTSGVYTWLAYYLEKTYNLSGRSIAFALLGYGIPGLVFGPLIGRLVDRYGRSKLLPSGLALGSSSVFTLILSVSLVVIRVAIITLSLGFDLTQPLLAGIISQVGKKRGGQAMSVMAFMLFVGFGLGSYFFKLALNLSLETALIIFGSFQLGLSLLGFWVFRKERFVGSAQPAQV